MQAIYNKEMTERSDRPFPAKLLLGKTALVTGASRGIGTSVAYQLAAIGADVAINYRSKGPRAQEVATAIKALGRRALLLQADITSPESLAKVRATKKALKEKAKAKAASAGTGG